MKVGYAWLAERPEIKAPMPDRYAEVRSVSRIEQIEACLAIPSSVAPLPTILDQSMFALKYEGVNLLILSQALPLIDENELNSAFEASPTSQYLRKLCFLYEAFAKRQLASNTSQLKANYLPLFDPDVYITTEGIRNSRWRILWNGIGNIEYCVIVRKTDVMNAFLEENLLEQVENFTKSLPTNLLSRTLAWAYLDETRNSYAIEKEAPTVDKLNRFVELLKQAHKARTLNEEYLVTLQNATVTNNYVKAYSFRTDQNYLSSGQRGAIGVSYIPPPPSLANELMNQLLMLVNQPPKGIDPIVLATIVSFAFVYIHPFMDGNGRLSRFLFHYVLCQMGGLKNGLLLPVSAVLRKDEVGYKTALESWSSKIRDYWTIDWFDRNQLQLDFKGHDSLYRYWDATSPVTYMFYAVKQALEQQLKQETEYLLHYDAIYQKADSQFDVVNSDLSNLIIFCMELRGRISVNRRKQYKDRVPAELFEFIEELYITTKQKH